MSLFEDRVEQLGERVKERQQETDRNRRIEKIRGARKKEIDEAPNMQQMDFWCKDCKKDFIATGYKSVDKDMCAAFLASCPNGHGAVRYITDVHKDPYFHLSNKVKHEREKYADYFVTPDNPRFKVLYPQAWAALELGREKRHERDKGIQG